MSTARTLATTRRVLQQLEHDRRSIALLLLVPSILLTLFKYVYSGDSRAFDRIGPQLLGIFPFVVMFLITSVTMVRERTSGTLERLLTTRLRRSELVGGYGLAFGVAAVAQAMVTAAVAIGPLRMDVHHTAVIGLFAILDALLGTSLGLLMSAFAVTEFQAVQFMPAVVLPQLLLCGLLNPRSAMSYPLRWVSDVMPLSYATDGISAAAGHPGLAGTVYFDGAVVLGCLLLAVALAGATLRRRTD
ncbi:MAG: ABC transporter permease [Jatrophihabitantaceae bacterium]